MQPFQPLATTGRRAYFAAAIVLLATSSRLGAIPVHQDGSLTASAAALCGNSCSGRFPFTAGNFYGCILQNSLIAYADSDNPPGTQEEGSYDSPDETLPADGSGAYDRGGYDQSSQSDADGSPGGGYNEGPGYDDGRGYDDRTGYGDGENPPDTGETVEPGEYGEPGGWDE